MKHVGSRYMQEYDEEGTALETIIDMYETVLKIKMILSKKNGTFEWDLIDELEFNVDDKDHIDLIIQSGQRFGPILPLIMQQRNDELFKVYVNKFY